MNLTKQLMIAFIVILGSFGISFSAYAEKTAYVDVAKVFDQYEKTKKFDQQLAEMGKEKQTVRDSLVLDVRRLKDEMALLSDSGKGEKQLLVDKKLRELQEFDRGAQKELGEKREGIIKDVFKDIDDVIKVYGQKNNYDFIFNERLMLFRNDKYDITDEILGELNAQYKKK